MTEEEKKVMLHDFNSIATSVEQGVHLLEKQLNDGCSESNLKIIELLKQKIIDLNTCIKKIE